MESKSLEQARFIHEVLQLIRMRAIPKNLCSLQSENGPIDLTMPQMHALLVAHNLGGASIKELSEAMDVSAPSASAMVERLVEMGLLSREQNPKDRREVVVSLSELGEQVFARMERAILQNLVALIEAIGPEYAEKWCDVYARIRDVLTADEAPALNQPGARS